jgi:hypothetical protein
MIKSAQPVALNTLAVLARYDLALDSILLPAQVNQL